MCRPGSGSTRRDFGWAGGPGIKLSPGRHVLEVEADGRRKVVKRVFVKREEAKSINVDLAP